MASTSYSQQPGNPAAYDFHAYYGGTGSPNEYGTPHGHGHIHIQNGQVEYHRMPVERGLGQIAVNGHFHS
jgi:hypothetical protein